MIILIEKSLSTFPALWLVYTISVINLNCDTKKQKKTFIFHLELHFPIIRWHIIFPKSVLRKF